MHEIDHDAARPRVDRKSLLAGVAIGLFPLALLAAQQRSGTDDEPKFPRYQVAAWSDATGDRHGAFVVNTETGELVAVLGRSYVTEGRITADHVVQNVAR